jgi:hypothetical protein
MIFWKQQLSQSQPRADAMSRFISKKPGVVGHAGPGNTIRPMSSMLLAILNFCAKRVPNELIQSIIFARCRGDSLEADLLPPWLRWKGQLAKLQPDESLLYHPMSTVGVIVIANWWFSIKYTTLVGESRMKQPRFLQYIKSSFTTNYLSSTFLLNRV